MSVFILGLSPPNPWDPLTYERVKLLAEIVAFIALSAVMWLALKARHWLADYFGKRQTRSFLIGATIFYSGYLANVLNDVFSAEFMKIIDDVLVAVGMVWIVITARRFYRAIKIRVEPVKVSSGNGTLKSGAYFYPFEKPVEGLIKVLGGKKVIAVTRRKETFERLGVPYVWVSKVEGENTIHPTRLAPLLQTLLERSDEDTVVVMDGIEYMILENSFESFFKFLTSLKDHLLTKGAALVVIFDPKAVGEKETKILMDELEELS